MSTWSKDELGKIAQADDLHISPFREDGRTYNTGCNRRKSPTGSVAAGLALHSIGTAGFEPATP